MTRAIVMALLTHAAYSSIDGDRTLSLCGVVAAGVVSLLADWIDRRG